MRPIFVAVLTSSLAITHVRAETPAPVTLRQCYDWASARSESLKMRREDIRQSDARARAALGGILPQVDWELNDTWQDPAGVDELEKQGFAGFVEENQIESKFTAKQPLFSGLREFSARSGFKKESARDALRFERASRELFERTAAAFYAVLAHETDRDNTDAALKLAEDRVKELSGFRKLGKARDSEVFTAQAHAAALKASLQQIYARIIAAREDLSFLTGQTLNTSPLADEIPDLPAFGPLQEAMNQSLQRTDLRAQREDVAAKKLRVRYEKGFFWPTADLTGSYYTQRATFLEEIQWDVVLGVKVPLFHGGQTSARVREAASAHRQASLALEEMERQVLHSVRKAHGELAAAVREVKALEEAADAAEKSYDALREEYGLGLVTNLDVLQALDLLQTQRSARDTARLKAKLLFIQLSVSTERMP